MTLTVLPDYKRSIDQYLSLQMSQPCLQNYSVPEAGEKWPGCQDSPHRKGFFLFFFFNTKLGKKWPDIIHEPELGLFLHFLPPALIFLVHLSCLCQEGQINQQERKKGKES